MPKFTGRQVSIGLAVEGTPGTAASPTVYPKWTDFSIQGVSEKSMFQSARGIRNATSDSYQQRKYSEGSMTVVPNTAVAPYIYKAALGSLSTAGAGDASGSVYDHTITVDNSDAEPVTLSAVADDAGNVTEEFTNLVVGSATIQASDDWAELSVDVNGQFPSSGSLTESYTDEYEFAYNDMEVSFGTDVSTADGNSQTNLQSFELAIENDVLLDEAFLSGNNTIPDGGLPLGDREVTGSYSLQFENTTELDKYKNNTKEACVVEFIGGDLGTDPTKEKLRFELGKLVLTSPPKEYATDGLVTLTQEFTVEHDSSDGDITVVVTNDNDGTNY